MHTYRPIEINSLRHGPAWLRCFLFPTTMICLMAFHGPSARAALVIDGFTTAQTVSIPASGSSPAISFGSLGTAPGEALGNERDIQVDRTVGTGLVQVDVAQTIMPGAVFSLSFATQGSALLKWDGVNGSPALNPTGLGGIDLTQGGNNNAFSIGSASDLGSWLRVTVYTDAANFSEYKLGIASGGTFQNNLQLFSNPTAVTGAGADFTQVGAITLYIDGSKPSLDVGISSFSVVPEAPEWLMSLGACGMLLGLSAACARHAPRNPSLRA